MKPVQPQTPKPDKRRGIVIIAVLIVVAALALAGYHHSDMMTSEYKASGNSHRSVQARRAAESGIHYAAAVLSDPANFAGVLNGNPWNNPAAFRDIQLPGDTKALGRFSIIAPPDVDGLTDSTEPIFGVMDEGGKINLNALYARTDSGQAAFEMLIKLPNMTEEIANNILAWMGIPLGTQNNGAQNDYYSGLNPPYRCKNGPLDSLDELLLVKGVTRELLYGSDSNRNGVRDGKEDDTAGFGRGWSAYLTVHSRLQNRDPQGNPYIDINPDFGTSLQSLYDSLTQTDLSEEMIKFIIVYLQRRSSLPQAQAGDLTADEINVAGNSLKNITSIFELVNAEASIQVPRPGGGFLNKKYTSPLKDNPTKQREELSKLLAYCTVKKETDLPARININTASEAVLKTLTGITPTVGKQLTEAQIADIIAKRPNPTASEPPGEIYRSLAWLVSEANIDPKTMRDLEPFITTHTQVYRVQSVGYGEGKGPAVRIEAVIDTNAGRPRIIAWRDLSELGKGLPSMTANP